MAQPGAMSVCDAGRLRTCWFETWKRDSDCEKAVVTATVNNSCTCSLGSSQTAGRDLGAGVQMFPAQRRHWKFARRCKCQSNFFQLIPLTCLCGNKRKLNCDREPVWKIKLYICGVEGSSPAGSLQSDESRAATNNYGMHFLLKMSVWMLRCALLEMQK